VKWTVIVATGTLKILAAAARMRPAHDVRDVDAVLDRCRAPVKKLVADKGYDSERVHASCHERGITSIIPSRRGVHRGRYRRKMRRFFNTRVYHRRETVECTFSVLKRRCGGSVRCRKARTVRVEFDFRAIAHNLKILALKRLFQRGLTIRNFYKAVFFGLPSRDIPRWPL
jgi:transposase